MGLTPGAGLRLPQVTCSQGLTAQGGQELEPGPGPASRAQGSAGEAQGHMGCTQGSREGVPPPAAHPYLHGAWEERQGGSQGATRPVPGALKISLESFCLASLRTERTCVPDSLVCRKQFLLRRFASFSHSLCSHTGDAALRGQGSTYPGLWFPPSPTGKPSIREAEDAGSLVDTTEVAPGDPGSGPRPGLSPPRMLPPPHRARQLWLLHAGASAPSPEPPAQVVTSPAPNLALSSAVLRPRPPGVSVPIWSPVVLALGSGHRTLSSPPLQALPGPGQATRAPQCRH